MSLRQTPSQTIGPYFAYGLAARAYGYPGTEAFGATLADERAPGMPILIEGRVLDGKGVAIDDALVEIWQADSQGRYVEGTEAAKGGFTGFGRCGTGIHADNFFRFRTIMPGVPAPGEAPHINVILFMRGLLGHLFTRLYFADLAIANAADPLLSQLPIDRRRTLVATRIERPAHPVYRFDIHMQGPNETVFFDL